MKFRTNFKPSVYKLRKWREIYLEPIFDSKFCGTTIDNTPLNKAHNTRTLYLGNLEFKLLDLRWGLQSNNLIHFKLSKAVAEDKIIARFNGLTSVNLHNESTNYPKNFQIFVDLNIGDEKYVARVIILLLKSVSQKVKKEITTFISDSFAKSPLTRESILFEILENNFLNQLSLLTKVNYSEIRKLKFIKIKPKK